MIKRRYEAEDMIDYDRDWHEKPWRNGGWKRKKKRAEKGTYVLDRRPE